MADIELVIKIDKDTLKRYQESVDCEERAIIVHGTPLPKGHGRLINVDEVIKIANKTKDLHGAIWNASTIIESDTEPIKENSIEQLIDDIEGLTWYRNVHGNLVEGATNETGLYKASDIAKILEKYKRGVEE